MVENNSRAASKGRKGRLSFLFLPSSACLHVAVDRGEGEDGEAGRRKG